ncbi:MAG: FAD-binding protein [Candidatus Tectomicrobia bacterium]|nr:FAD-binding protein [Candidatus Tectomicrobia bacterium]
MLPKGVVDQELRVDLLVLGSEGAGAKAAIEAYDLGVTNSVMVTKGFFGKSGVTLMAGRAVQAALGHMDPHDNPEVHLKDTVEVGGYLTNQKLSERLVTLALTEIPKLETWGARFQKEGDKFFQIQLPGASYPRSCTSAVQQGGLEWRRAYKAQARKRRLRVLENVFVTSLMTKGGRVCGATAVNLADGQFYLLRAKAVVLACGGATQLFPHTDAALEATGDGMALAYRAGCDLVDMEFHMFFPFGVLWPTGFQGQIWPADFRYRLRAKFYNNLGEEFLLRYQPEWGNWGLRDPTSQAIYLENLYGRGSPHGGAYLSINHLPRNMIDNFIAKFHRNRKKWYWTKLQQLGVDLRTDAIEVGPVSHYTMGGVRVDECCRTTLQGLFAAGEVAGGMDGAERLDGGPAITWTQTMGLICAQESAAHLQGAELPEIDAQQVREARERAYQPLARSEGPRGYEAKRLVKQLMGAACTFVRDEARLREGLARLARLREEVLPRLSANPTRRYNRDWVHALEAQNLADVAELVLHAALTRRESRKAHFRSDFPKEDPAWIKNVILRRGGDGRLEVQIVDPVMTKVFPPVTTPSGRDGSA